MKITDKHPDYNARIGQWSRCRHAIEGGDAIKAKAEAYLPKLAGQNETEYSNYLMRALWFNATARTVDAMTGEITRKPAAVEAPAGADGLLVDIDMSGTPLEPFAAEVLEDVVGVGRVGLLIDFPVGDGGATIAEAEAFGLRPFVIRYPAESVINWTIGAINHKKALVRVVLVESEGEEEAIRELTLEGGYYSVNTWKRPAKGKDHIIVETVVPLMRGEPLKEIPFWFAGPEFGDFKCPAPPLLDLVDVNLSHYRTMADLEHGRFFCGLPTPVLAGFSFENGQGLKLGSETGLVTPDPSAKWGYLEFGGAGLTALEKAAEQKEMMMARLGARLLMQDANRQAETAETSRIRASGEASVLASIAVAVSQTLTQVLQFLCRWAGLDPRASIVLNTDFEPAHMTAQELTALLGAVQAGQLPRIDFFRALKKGGVVAEDRTWEDFEAETPTPGLESLGDSGAV